jgi:two-component system cell cycle sensor histidine kinase/response regulator CckA
MLSSLEGGETILLVEDEAVVRNVVTAILEGQGYTVLAAASGEAAVEISADASTPIDLLLSDLVMAGYDGRETAMRVRENRPLVKVLFMSGYSNNAAGGDAAVEPATGFIQKPFHGDELARRVRELLDEDAQPLRNP